MHGVRKSLSAHGTDTSPGCLLFSGDCSRTPMGACMLISNNVLSKWNVALHWVVSLYSIFDYFLPLQSTSPSLTEDVVSRAAPVSHYCYWWFSNRLLSLLSPLCSCSFPPFSYCQHTFTSNSVACTRLFPLLIPQHAIHMISTAPFLLSLLPLQSQHK